MGVIRQVVKRETRRGGTSHIRSSDDAAGRCRNYRNWIRVKYSWGFEPVTLSGSTYWVHCIIGVSEIVITLYKGFGLNMVVI